MPIPRANYRCILVGELECDRGIPMRKITLLVTPVAAFILIGITIVDTGRNTQSYQRACWFDFRSIGDDNGCKGSTYYDDYSVVFVGRDYAAESFAV